LEIELDLAGERVAGLDRPMWLSTAEVCALLGLERRAGERLALKLAFGPPSPTHRTRHYHIEAIAAWAGRGFDEDELKDAQVAARPKHVAAQRERAIKEGQDAARALAAARSLPKRIVDALLDLADAAWARWCYSAVEQAAYPRGPVHKPPADLTGKHADAVKLILRARDRQWRDKVSATKAARRRDALDDYKAPSRFDVL
jgi:hypothetical protein